MNFVIIFLFLVASKTNTEEDSFLSVKETTDNLKQEKIDNSIHKNNFLNSRVLDSTNIVQKSDNNEITGNCGSEINYIINKISHTVTISGSGPMTNYSIGESPFYTNKIYIKNIIIEEGITSIGSYSFYLCSSLFSITLPNSLISIEKSSFEYCSSLYSINIPESVKFIEEYAFCYCESLESVIIEGNVSKINKNNFYSCLQLTYFYYKGSNYPTIGSYVLSSCSQLSKVTVNFDFEGTRFGDKNVYFLPPTDRTIDTGTCGNDAIYSMDFQTNTFTVSGSGKMEDFDGIYNKFRKFSDSAKIIKIIDNIDTIGRYSFSYFGNVETVIIEAPITEIESRAFSDCSKLQNINIPLTVTSIGSYAFASCISLLAADISSVTSVSTGIFNQCHKLTSFDIPAGITSIPDDFFSSCLSLATVNIADTIESIQNRAFYNCEKLKYIILPNSIKYISSNSFAFCESLCSVTFSDSLIYIGREAFKKCYSIISLHLPDSLVEIDKNAFSFCSNLESLVFSDNLETIENEAFYGCYLITSIDIPIKTVLIGNYAFEKCISLRHVSYKGIRDPTNGPNAFKNCSNLSSIDVQSYYEDDTMSGIQINKIASTETLEVTGTCGENVNYKLSIKTGELAITGSGQMFNYSESEVSPFLTNRVFIKHVSVDGTVSSIGNYCFNNCTYTVSITLNDNIDYIGTYAFHNCSSLLSITIPSKVNYIHEKSFSHCTKLGSVIIEGNITRFDNYGFENCLSLTYIFYKGYIKSYYGYTCFNTDNYLKYVDVMDYYQGDVFITYSVRKIPTPESIEVQGKCGENLNYKINPALGTLKISGTGEMQHYTSSGDTTTPFKLNVKYATIESGVTSIGDYSFYQCKTLLTIDLPNTVATIGNYAFRECSCLMSLVLPNVNVVNKYAFYNCSSLETLSIECNASNLDTYCFYHCSSLKSVVYKGTEVPKYNFPFYGSDLNGCDKLRSAITMYNYFPDKFCFVQITKRVIPTGTQEKSGECGADIKYKFNFGTNTLTITGSGDMTNYEAKTSPFQEFKHFLKNVVIEGTITSIGSYAFYNIPLIESVTINCNLKTISDNAFYLCSNISYFLYTGEVPSFSSNALPSSWKLLAVDVMYNYKSNTFDTFPINRILPKDAQEVNGECGPSVTFTYTFSSNTLTIKGSGNMKNYYEEKSPIQDFKHFLEHVIIGDKVSSIGNYAFYQCKFLSSIIISNSVTSIGCHAFDSCLSLSSIDLSSITSLDYGAFRYCISLKSFEISTGIQIIQNSLLSCCTSLTSVTIPNTVQSIEYNAFTQCPNLTTFIMPESVKSISSFAFYCCISLASIDLSQVTYIDNNAFCGCESLASVNIGSLTAISYSAFEECTSLTSLEIPNGIDKITISLLKGCSKLSKVTIPESVKLIDKDAFYNCSSLTSIIIPNKVVEIRIGAFAKCKKLESVTLSENIEVIGDEAFQFCDLITSITISMKAVYIGNFAFEGCKSLNSVTYKGIRDPTIGPSAFYHCNQLSSIDVQSYYENDTLSGIQVNKITSTETLEITGTCGESVNYKLSIKTGELEITGSGQMFNYSESEVSPFLTNRVFIKQVSFDETVSSIGSYLFKDCTSITSITFNNINSIGTYAFYNCSSLSTITIPSQVNSINEYSFAFCVKLTSITFQGEVTTIRSYGFAYCSALSYIFYKGINEPTIAEYSFTNSNLEFVDVLNAYGSDTFKKITVRKITSTENMKVEGNCGTNVQYSIDPLLGTMRIFGEGEMQSYSRSDTNNKPFRMNVKSLTIESGVTSIGSFAFYHCKSLSSVDISNTVTQIGNNAFEGCTILTSLVLPNVSTIESSAFYECTSLQTLTILSDISFRYNSFIFCYSLSHITYKASYVHYYPDTFSNCYRLKSIVTNYNFASDNFCGIPIVQRLIPTDVEEINGKIDFGLTYTYTFSSNTLNIKGSGSMADFKEKTSPIRKFKYILRNVVIEDKVTTIGSYAFQDCSLLSSITIPTSVVIIGEFAFSHCFSLTSITTASVESFGAGAFEYCTSLTSFEFSPKVTTIPDSLFECCTSITSLNIPSSVISIGKKAFKDCISISTINDLESVTSIDESAFINCSSLKSINIPSVTFLGEGSFKYCESLTSFNIPLGINKIPIEMLSYGINIESITIPNNIIIIAELAFRGCSKITTLQIPDSVTSILQSAFEECLSLKSVTIDGNLNVIEAYAFGRCPLLTDFLYKGFNEPLYGVVGPYVFEKSDQLTAVKVLNHYVSDTFSKMIVKSEGNEDPGNGEVNGKCGFDLTYNYKYDTKILTINGSGTMYDYNSLNSPFTKIKSSLTTVNIKGTPSSIGSYAFNDCSALSTINIPNSVISIKSNAFSYCTSLNTINITSTQMVGANVFEHSSLSSIEMASVTFLGYGVFQFCDKFVSFDLPSGIKTIPYALLRCCTSVISINIPNSVEKIGISAFYNCSSLSSIVVNSNLSSIYSNAFSLCSSLSFFSYKGTTRPSVDDDAFNGCDKLTEIIVTKNYKYDKFGNYNASKKSCDFNAPVGCNICEEENPSKCLSCDKSIFFEETVGSDGKCKCMSEYVLNEDGKCVPLTGKCDQVATNRGCSVCAISSPSTCIECDENRGFNKSPSSSNTCECKNEGYQINDQGQCVLSIEDNSCDPNAQLYGCLKCVPNNNKMCSLCDESQSFKKTPNDKGMCTCQVNYTLTTNGKCTIQVKKDPVLSFIEYTATEEIPQSCITPSSEKAAITLDASSLINSEDFNNSKLYKTEVNEEVREVNVKNSADNVQVKINNRKGAELNVQVDQNVPIQLDTSNSDFPINLPPNSQSVSIVVDSAKSTLEVGSINNDKEDVNIGNVSISSQTFVLNPKNNVTVDYVNLFGEAELSRTNKDLEETIVEAKKVNLQQGSVSKISNITISEELNLAPNSVVTIKEGVDFSSADISIYKTDSQPIDYSYFQFTEEVKQSPKDIKIKEMESNEFLAKSTDKVIIIHLENNLFKEDMCMKWAEHVNDSNGYKGVCTKNDVFNEGHNSVYAIKETNLDDPNTSSTTPKNNPLSKGAIAGIVVGCVVVVAAIIVLVIFLVKRSKNKVNSSTEDGNNDDDII